MKKTLLGTPYSDLGPPRKVSSLDAMDEEIARQRRLQAAGLLRRGYSEKGRLVTLGWQQFTSGKFAWHGFDNHGIAIWGGQTTGAVGGYWPSAGDYVRAWKAGQKLAPRDFDLLDLFEGTTL